MTFSECHTSALGDKPVASLSSLWWHESRQWLSAGFPALDIKNTIGIGRFTVLVSVIVFWNAKVLCFQQTFTLYSLVYVCVHAYSHTGICVIWLYCHVQMKLSQITIVLIERDPLTLPFNKPVYCSVRTMRDYVVSGLLLWLQIHFYAC